MQNSRREYLLLPILALVGALLMSGVYLGVKARIAANQRHLGDKILLDALALPADTTLRTTDTTQDSALLMLRAPQRIYLAQQRGQIVAIILPVTAPAGYNGAIDLIVGVEPDGKIIGVHATAHRETAGLGDRIDIDKSDWLKQFIGKTLDSAKNIADAQNTRWALKGDGGDFDQITGATVTSRAVVDAVRQALQYFAQHREQLLRDIDRD